MQALGRPQPQPENSGLQASRTAWRALRSRAQLVGAQEAGAAAEATIQMLRAELADSHCAESAAQESSWQASSDLSQVISSS